MVRLLTTLSLLCLAISGYCRKNITLVSASERSWSGGIAGHSGSNYSFVIDFTGLKKEINPDTLWIGDQPILLHDRKHWPQGNFSLARSGDTQRLSIDAGTSRDEYAERNPSPHTKPSDKPKPPHYEGVALLCYSWEGRRHTFVISKITTHYPPVNYP